MQEREPPHRYFCLGPGPARKVPRAISHDGEQAWAHEPRPHLVIGPRLGWEDRQLACDAPRAEGPQDHAAAHAVVLRVGNQMLQHCQVDAPKVEWHRGIPLDDRFRELLLKGRPEDLAVVGEVHGEDGPLDVGRDVVAPHEGLFPVCILRVDRAQVAPRRRLHVRHLEPSMIALASYDGVVAVTCPPTSLVHETICHRFKAQRALQHVKARVVVLWGATGHAQDGAGRAIREGFPTPTDLHQHDHGHLDLQQLGDALVPYTGQVTCILRQLQLRLQLIGQERQEVVVDDRHHQRSLVAPHEEVGSD